MSKLDREEYLKYKLQYKLECLQLSHDINFKMGNLKSSYKDDKEFFDDLKDVFKLSDIYFQYMVDGVYPSYEGK
jgi:hypothetical protein